MKFFLAFIALIILNFDSSYSQEIIGINDGMNYNLNCELFDKYDIVRTDQSGNIIWKLSFIGDNINFDDKQELYLILGFTNDKNGKILSDPTDYDYWLLPKKTKYEFSIYPNPNLGSFTIYSDYFSNTAQYQIYDSTFRLILNTKFTDRYTNINLENISQGVYFLRIYDNEETLKFEKICIN